MATTTDDDPPEARGLAHDRDPLLWVRRGIALGVLALGWTFILWQNKFRVTPPTVFVCLGFLAIVATVYALWRTGVVAVEEPGDDEDEAGADSTWGRPLGARGELEREKRTLLKAIKEAEFDREMGKLSAADADEMIKVYRVRAIEVIKEIDRLEAGAAGSVREQIEREVRARLELEGKTAGAAKKAADGAASKKKGKAAAAPAEARAADASEEAPAPPAVDAGASEPPSGKEASP